MNDSQAPDQPFEVFYDEQCPLCRKEINFIRKRDKHSRLKLTDISASDFDPTSTGKSLDLLMREIHGRYSDGSGNWSRSLPRDLPANRIWRLCHSNALVRSSLDHGSFLQHLRRAAIQTCKKTHGQKCLPSSDKVNV